MSLSINFKNQKKNKFIVKSIPKTNNEKQWSEKSEINPLKKLNYRKKNQKKTLITFFTKDFKSIIEGLNKHY